MSLTKFSSRVKKRDFDAAYTPGPYGPICWMTLGVHSGTYPDELGPSKCRGDECSAWQPNWTDPSIGVCGARNWHSFDYVDDEGDPNAA